MQGYAMQRMPQTKLFELFLAVPTVKCQGKSSDIIISWSMWRGRFKFCAGMI